MRKSLILFTIVFAYIWGCSSSEDKYDLITKDDRKVISSFCKCLEPLTYYNNKITSSNDSLTKAIYTDSFQVKVIELAPCLEEADRIELKFGKSKDYNKQFIQYVKDKHPDCVSIWLSESNKDTP